ncbi:MAG: phosphate ABC transporter permease PstA [Eubacteriales bacterium]
MLPNDIATASGVEAGSIPRSAARDTLYRRRVRPVDGLLHTLLCMSAGLTVLLLAGILGYVVVRGIPVIDWSFLSTGYSMRNNTDGILPYLINTLYIVVITLLITTPIGVGGAIYLNEYASRGRLVRLIEATIEILAGIPSIIYGLFGMVVFGSIVYGYENGKPLTLGYSILTGCLTLAILVLPILIRTTQEALKTVPTSYREGAMGIGATKWYMIRTILLPSAMPGILTGIILSIGRIVGESAALIFTAGSGYDLPKEGLMGAASHVMDSSATLTVKMYLAANEGYNDTAFGAALVLVVLVLIINALTKVVSRRVGNKA